MGAVAELQQPAVAAEPATPLAGGGVGQPAAEQVVTELPRRPAGHGGVISAGRELTLLGRHAWGPDRDAVTRGDGASRKFNHSKR